MAAIIILGSVSHISLPLVVSSYPSVFFVIFMCSVQGILIYGFSLFCFRIYVKKRYLSYHECTLYFSLYDYLLKDFEIIKQQWKTIISVGISNAFMCYLMMYSANPIRTPVVIQSVFLGLAILSSIVFSKMFLNKKTEFNWPFALISILFLLGSVGIAIIPLVDSNLNFTNDFHLLWVFMFLFGVFAYSLTNVLQEKYQIDSHNSTFDNKLRLAFYSSVCQFICVMLLCWLDIFIGYGIPNHTNNSQYTPKEPESQTSFDLFVQCFQTMFSNIISFVILEIFIILWFSLFLLAVALNEISTNYTMILTNITNQSVALFFIIFPHLNHGIKYPWFVTVGSLSSSFISVIFWINAEKPINRLDDSEIAI